MCVGRREALNLPLSDLMLFLFTFTSRYVRRKTEFSSLLLKGNTKTSTSGVLARNLYKKVECKCWYFALVSFLFNPLKHMADIFNADFRF